MRRKRKTRYQWLDQFGTAGPAADVTDDRVIREFAFTVPANGTTATAIFDWIPDFPSEDVVAATAINSMGVFDRNEYFLKRVVGKCFLSTFPSINLTAPGIIAGVGLFIARAEDGAISTALPVGAGAVPNNYNVFRTENTKEPWIWRRSWILSNSNSTSTDLQGLRLFPTNNTKYGSVLDGPHVDAKTARRIRDGERFFIAVSAMNLPLGAVESVGVDLWGWFDLRLLGAPRRSRNRSVF